MDHLALKLYYIHDPMCSWCFAFRQSLQPLLQQLPEEIEVRKLLGGLAADSTEPMPADMQQQLQSTWQRIEQKVPEVHFNYDFWTRCKPVRSTYPACRAVIAARILNTNNEKDIEKDMDKLMTMAIQDGYYLQAQNPSEENTLADFAQQLGLSRDKFITILHSEAVNQTLVEEINLSRQLGVRSFPALVLKIDKSPQPRQEKHESYWPVSIDYLDPSTMLETIAMLREFC